MAMKYFRVKADEKAAVREFRINCVPDELHIIASRRSITGLQLIAKRKPGEDLEEISSQIVQTLARKGMIRQDADGEWWITEIGLLTLALAEAGGLLRAKNVDDVK
jgi:hypothetical protein